MSRVKIKHGMIEAEVDEEEEEYIQTGSKSASAPIPHQHMKQRQVMTVLEPLEEADGRLGRFCEGTVLLGYSTRCTILHDIVRIQHTTARPTKDHHDVSSGWKIIMTAGWNMWDHVMSGTRPKRDLVLPLRPHGEALVGLASA